jgi:hypothetical protein
VRLYRDVRGITLVPDRRAVGRLESWARRHRPGAELAAVETVARTYLLDSDPILETRGWPLPWLADRAPGLAAQRTKPSAEAMERESGARAERLAAAEDRAAAEARARGDDELADAHEASARRLRGLSAPDEATDRWRRAARTVEARSAV